MKSFNDTYSRLSDNKVHIGKNTVIHTDDAVILSYLNGVREDVVGVSDIFFLPFDEDVKETVKSIFPESEEATDESYFIDFNNAAISVYASEKRGRIYSASLISVRYSCGINEGEIYNVPLCGFRGFRTYVPGRNEIGFFKHVIDMCTYYGLNTVFMEVGGAMEFKRHPEINEGWEEYASIFKEYIGKSVKAQRCMPQNKDSIHWENGGGSFLLQSELRELIAYANAHGIDIIPEVPSLSHSDYLLTRHPELAENVADPIPDTYCPSNPDVYPLLFDVIDEVIEVFKPKAIHIGHDEWYSACICQRCRGKDPAKLYSDDVTKIHDYVKTYGIDVIMWADMLVACKDKFGNVRGSGVSIAKLPTTETVEIRGRLYNVNKELWCSVAENIAYQGGTAVFHAPRTKACADTLPKDIIMMNWLHHYDEDIDLEYLDRGMRTVYGNFYPRSFKNWFKCIKRGVGGAAISNWSFFDKNHAQRMSVLFGIAYSSMMMWNRDFDEDKVRENTFEVAHSLFEYQRKLNAKKHSATILHGSSVKIPHETYWDGVTIDYEKDKMGEYKIVYKDGTSESVDIHYGCNIGIIHSANYDPTADPGGTATHILEPIYTCDYEVVGDEVYYKYIIDSDKEIERVIPEISDKHLENVKILKITID